MDYANVMRTALEYGPDCFQPYCYFGKQLVNSSMFFAQLGFCTVYFVFMADNLKQFFDQTSYIHISQAGWIALLLIPTLALCTIRELVCFLEYVSTELISRKSWRHLHSLEMLFIWWLLESFCMTYSLI